MDIEFNSEKREFAGITEQDLYFWQDAFPLVAVLQEIKSAAQWLYDNPKKKKKNNRRFIGNWLRRAQKDRLDLAGRKLSGLPVCKRCGRPAYIWTYDNAGIPYWVCKEHTPPSKLPAEILKIAVAALKKVPANLTDKDINDIRNKNLNALKAL